MTNWNKKSVSKSEVEELTRKYGVDPITASIMVRRNIVEGKQVLYLMEDDLRFQHRPFQFNNMEEAVDRILEAKEEGEKILIFGLANDELGYVLPPNDFILNEDAPYMDKAIDVHGRRHYEETNSMGPKTAATIAAALEKTVNAFNAK